MNSSLVHMLYDDIVGFLAEPSLPFMPVRGKKMASAREDYPVGLSLFRYMTEYKRAEIRAQDALFPFLVSKYDKVERERPWRSENDRRSFDFFVEHRGEEVIIELKHLSPHQSGRHPESDRFLNLLGPIVAPSGRRIPTIYDDLRKSRPDGVPLLQLGLYTGVDSWSHGVPSRQVDNYFIKRYVSRAMPSSMYKSASERVFQQWEYRHEYRCPTTSSSGLNFIEGQESTFLTPSGIEVTGRVNYFIGIAV